MTDKQTVRRFFDFTFPELGTNIDDEFDFFYEQALKTLTKKYWRSLWVDGMAYWIAHSIAMRNKAKDGDGTGAVPKVATSKSIGKLAVGFGSVAGEEAYAGAGEYATTTYGRHFWYLLNMTSPTGMVV